MEELKKEFFEKFAGRFIYRQDYEVIPQWIERNFVPKSEVADLKAENEQLKTKLKNAHETIIDLKNAIVVNVIEQKDKLAEARSEKLGYFIFKDACGERVNKNIYNKYDGFKQVLPIETDRIKAQARKEERAKVSQTVQKLNEYANNEMNMIPTTQSEIREDIFYSGYKLALIHLEKELIEPQQSCEGCEYDTPHNDNCQPCDTNFSNYQVRK